MKKDQTVIGSYKTEDETIKIIKRLITEGYKKDEITLFTNQERNDTLDNPEHVDVTETNMQDSTESGDEDKNFWESIKDAFKVREDHHFDDPNYTADNELLYRYRDNLNRGEIVIVVDNFKADRSGESNNETPHEQTSNEVQDMTQATSSLGSIAGFPAEGTVQGVTNGGEPPLEPEESEGTPSELDRNPNKENNNTMNKRK